MRIAAKDIGRALESKGFQLQSDPDGIALVRPSATEHLFERFECMPVGQRHETLVISVALSVVKPTALRFRGLFVRDGWREVCSDPENGRVALRTPKELASWLESVNNLAIGRFERLVREKGPALLSATKEAREYAKTVHRLVEPTLKDGLREPFVNLTEAEVKIAESLMRLPFVVPSEELRNAVAVVVAAMVRSGDESVYRAALAPASIEKIARLRSVPDELLWKIRLAVNRILEW